MSASHGACHVALVVTLACVVAFVVEFLPLSEGQGNFSAPTLEIQFKRNESESLALDSADHLADLLAMQQELARARRLVVDVATAFVGRDMQVDEIDFAIANYAVCVGDVRLAIAQRFHFCPGERDAGFPGFQKLVVVRRPAVLRN